MPSTNLIVDGRSRMIQNQEQEYPYHIMAGTCESLVRKVSVEGAGTFVLLSIILVDGDKRLHLNAAYVDRHGRDHDRDRHPLAFPSR
jgi:hypothetical protein